MAKSEVIAIAAEREGLRGVRYTPRGRDAWVRTGGGVWTFEAPHKAMDADGVATEDGAALVEADKPLARAVCAAKMALGAHQVVLGLPLARLLVRMIRLPVEVRDDLADVVALQMDKLSPFPGEELSVGYEILSESEKELWVFAAAMPVAVFKELVVALQIAKLNVVRTDATVLGWFRSLCGPCGFTNAGRRLVLMDPDDGWDLLVVDNGVPVLVRGLGALVDAAAFIREITLSLMNAELDAGHQPVVDVLVISGKAPTPELSAKLMDLTGVEVRYMEPPATDGGVEGVALRSVEGASLDLTPQIWRDEFKAARIRKRILTGAGIALGLWALLMTILFSGPLVYRQMTARVNKASKEHAKAYKQVSDTRERVKLISAYMDRSFSALELLRMGAVNLPPGITLIGFNYRRDDGVKFSCEADAANLVYDFKDLMTADTLFETVTLIGPSLNKNKHKFDVEAKFKGAKKE